MKEQAIFVASWQRSRHLHVCLQSIARCAGVRDWDVWVDYDGGFDPTTYGIPLEHFSVHRTAHLGCRNHPTEIVRTALSFGYKRFLYAENDHLFRSDLLSYMTEHATFDGAVCAFHRPDGIETLVRHTSDSPNLYSAALGASLLDFMDNGRDIGLPDVCHPGHPICAANNYRDASWWQWALACNIRTLFAPEQLCLNFGYRGAHLHDSRFDELAFSGPPSTWFDSVLTTARRPEFANGMSTSADFTYR